jgi:hypothetical protein
LDGCTWDSLWLPAGWTLYRARRPPVSDSPRTEIFFLGPHVVWVSAVRRDGLGRADWDSLFVFLILRFWKNWLTSWIVNYLILVVGFYNIYLVFLYTKRLKNNFRWVFQLFIHFFRSLLFSVLKDGWKVSCLFLLFNWKSQLRSRKKHVMRELPHEWVGTVANTSSTSLLVVTMDPCPRQSITKDPDAVAICRRVKGISTI